MVSHASYHRTSVLPSVCSGWRLGRFFSQEVSAWSSPMCCGEMCIVQWASLHIHKDAAEHGCCLFCLCRRILQILPRPCLACQHQPAQLVSESGKQGLCSALLLHPFLPACLHCNLDQGSRCILTALSSIEHKCPCGQLCSLTP